MRSKSQILSKLRADGHITDEEYKMLEQEPCDDAISREAVLNAIEHEDKWLLAAKGHNGLTEIAFSGLKARVDALPSVTQKSETVTEFADRCRECGAKYGKLLKQEPCEDCISRQAVLEQIDQWAIGNREYLHTDAMHYLTRRMQDIPPVNPQPKTGHWIVHEIESTLKWLEYSNCHCETSYKVMYNYCPYCGAKKKVSE